MSRGVSRVTRTALGVLLLVGAVTGCAGTGSGARQTETTERGREAEAARTSGLAPAGPGRRMTQSATAPYTCMGAKGQVRLTASTGRRPGEVRFTLVTSGLRTPMSVAAGAVDATLTLDNSGGGPARTAVFRGTNPRLVAGQRVRLGPLVGRVARGDRLDSHRSGAGSAVRISYGLLNLDCRAESGQRPGPFRF